MSTGYVAAIDQGTTSTRCILFDHAGRVAGVDQREHRQILPRPGWVEHDPDEVWQNTLAVTSGALAAADARPSDVVAVGITNQRETAVVWERATGRAIHNAIVWQDTRTDAVCAALGELGGGPDRYRARTGLPLATYFSAPKVRWILDEVPGARARAETGELALGTMDSWVLWQLTGGALHATDPTNASRTLLMDLETLSWAPDIAAEIGVPSGMLPEIRSSSEVYGRVCDGQPLAGVPIAGILGDQQAATVGQACLDVGAAKNTYGTGNFVLRNTGQERVMSQNGLLTTVCYRFGAAPPVYALEGSIAVTGSLVQWLRDNIGIISSAADIEALASTVPDNGGAYLVPAFSGLFAPYWQPGARGALVGLTRFVNRGHLARAALEAVAFQSREVIEAMDADWAQAGGATDSTPLTALKVDGGMVGNELLMQFQADILDVPVIRPVVAETTALGAAYAAGLAIGYWDGEADVRANWQADKRWEPVMDPDRREELYARWRKAVTRTFDWV